MYCFFPFLFSNSFLSLAYLAIRFWKEAKRLKPRSNEVPSAVATGHGPGSVHFGASVLDSKHLNMAKWVKKKTPKGTIGGWVYLSDIRFFWVPFFDPQLHDYTNTFYKYL